MEYQGSILGLLLFLIYINDLNKAIQHSVKHHFANDTNLLYSSKSLKQINRYVKHDLQLIVHFLRANRISLNVDKTEIVIFQPERKQITENMNFRISSQKIIPKTQTKYLGLAFDEQLTWSACINILKKKLSRANGLLSKLSYSTSQNPFITIYYALFASHLSYGSQIWGQSKNQIINEVPKLQRKAFRIITFNNQFASAEPLFKELKVLPFHKMIQMLNCHLVLSRLNKNFPGTFTDFFKYANYQHQHHTRETYNNKITIPHFKTTHYGLQSIKYKTAKDCHEIQKELKNIDFSDEYLSKTKF